MQILHIRWEKARFLGYEIDSVLINLPTGEDDNSFPPLQGFRKGVPSCIVQGNAAPSGFAPDLPDPRFRLQVMDLRAGDFAQPSASIQRDSGNQKPFTAVSVDGFQKQIRFTSGQKPSAGVVHLRHIHLLKGALPLEQPPIS